MSTTEHAVRLDRADDASRTVRLRRWLHRATYLLLVVVLGLAVLDGADVVDAYGVDTGTVSAAGTTADGDEVELRVTYPSVTRPALASPFRIEVRRPGGWDGEVELAVRRHYLEAWDLNGILPAPSGEVADGEDVRWRFEAPEGDVLTVTYEARIEPGLQSARAGGVTLLDDGRPVAEVSFRTEVRP